MAKSVKKKPTKKNPLKTAGYAGRVLARSKKKSVFT
jgi:hypothetical protein